MAWHHQPGDDSCRDWVWIGAGLSCCLILTFGGGAAYNYSQSRTDVGAYAEAQGGARGDVHQHPRGPQALPVQVGTAQGRRHDTIVLVHIWLQYVYLCELGGAGYMGRGEAYLWRRMRRESTRAKWTKPSLSSEGCWKSMLFRTQPWPMMMAAEGAEFHLLAHVVSPATKPLPDHGPV
jgi:hypothetical protein